MKIVMLKLTNFQEVIAQIDDNKIEMDDFLSLNFEKLEISHALFVTGMSEGEHEGQKYAIPEFQPLNVFGESLEAPITLNASGILYTHQGNSGIREYYEHVVAQLTGGIVKPPEKNIIMPT